MIRLALAALVLWAMLPSALLAQPAQAAPSARAEALDSASIWRAEDQLDLAEEALWVAYALSPSADVVVELAEVAVGQGRPFAARALLESIPADTPGADAVLGGLPQAPSGRGIETSRRLREAGSLDAAEWALRGSGDSQTALIERAYIAASQKRSARARHYFTEASNGSDDELAVQAYRELWVLPKSMATTVFADARDARAAGDVVGVDRLLQALLPIEDRQTVALELGWTAWAAGDRETARRWLDEAAQGSDSALAAAAQAQIEDIDAPAAAEPAPPEQPVVTEPLVTEPVAALEPSEPEMPSVADTLAATMEAAKALRAEGQYVRAEEEFARARDLGASPQVIDMEVAYTMLDAQRGEAARLALIEASKGPDEDIAGRARELLVTVEQRLGQRFLEQARAYRLEQNYPMAVMSLETAEKQGATDCEVVLERAYLEADQGHGTKARAAFQQAARCEEPPIRDAARAELKSRYKLFWADMYAELYGWHRFLPVADTNTNLVPTLRLRGYIHPIPKLDLDPYVYFQISRDVGSRGQGPQGFPRILADNTMMFGGGILLRGWKRRVGVYAQIGPAINLLNDGRDRVWLDARVAAFFAVATPSCSPAPQLTAPGARVGFAGCAEVYAEAVWVSRFDNNIFTLGRGRLGFTALVTGPVAWQPIIEGRVLKDINDDYWNNLADVGMGIRWRLLTPFGLDVMAGVHGGSYFGLANEDPAPAQLGYAEFRLQAATYVAW